MKVLRSGMTRIFIFGCLTMSNHLTMLEGHTFPFILQVLALFRVFKSHTDVRKTSDSACSALINFAFI